MILRNDLTSWRILREIRELLEDNPESGEWAMQRRLLVFLRQNMKSRVCPIGHLVTHSFTADGKMVL